MDTDPTLSPAAWALSLSTIELAEQMIRLVADPHCMSAAERSVVLVRAADIVAQS